MFLTYVNNLKASDLINVSPITNQILLLHFDDGHCDYYGALENIGSDNVIYMNELNLQNAEHKGNYSITSEDHENWGTITPLSISRKSKGSDFPKDGLYIKEHWIYLYLPQSMQEGKTYTVHVGDLADNLNIYTFKFDSKKIFSETIHINIVGFAPSASKFAYLSQWLGDAGGLDLSGYKGKQFHIVDYQSGEIKFTGSIVLRMTKDIAEARSADEFGVSKNFTYADVYECDFSAFQSQGEFFVSVPEMGCSYPFEISAKVVHDVFYTAMRGLFFQRSGIVKEIEPGKIYPRDHHPDDYPHYYHPALITDKHEEPNAQMTNGTYPLNYPVKGIWGWYHDASDWDSYPHHAKIPFSLMSLFMIAPDKFHDGNIGNRYKLHENDVQWIDEGQNGLPDILDEAGWLVSFYKRARHALIDSGYGTGGVPGYVGREAGTWLNGWGKGLLPSWLDKRPVAITTEHPNQTFVYAGLAGMYAYCLNLAYQLGHPGENHPDFEMWKDEAISAFNWADANGANDAEAKALAGACVFMATGDNRYQTVAQKNFLSGGNVNWFDEGTAAPYSFFTAIGFALLPDTFPSLDKSWQSEMINYLKIRGGVNRTNAVGFRYGSFSEYSSFGYGYFSTPHTLLPAVIYKLTNNVTYANAVQHNLSYVLGGNQLNTVHMTGIGERSEKSPHHIDSWCLFNNSGPVYYWQPLPGFITYFGSEFTWVGGQTGIASHVWTRNSAYPEPEEYPRSESRFYNRESINGSEYTTSQNIVQGAFAAGFLFAMYGDAQKYEVHQRPTISLNLVDGQEISAGKPFTISSITSAHVRNVRYYYNWHFIGESFDTLRNFAFQWNIQESNVDTGEVLITAVAFDEFGKISAQTNEGERMVVLTTNVSSINDGRAVLPYSFKLNQNYPNPFNPTTNISFTIPSRSSVSLKIFDLLGREVATIFSEEMSVGNHSKQWNAAGLSSGVYFYRLSAVPSARRDLVPAEGRDGQDGSLMETKKLILLR